jgi:hypothetical protein
MKKCGVANIYVFIKNTFQRLTSIAQHLNVQRTNIFWCVAVVPWCSVYVYTKKVCFVTLFCFCYAMFCFYLGGCVRVKSVQFCK